MFNLKIALVGGLLMGIIAAALLANMIKKASILWKRAKGNCTTTWAERFNFAEFKKWNYSY